MPGPPAFLLRLLETRLSPHLFDSVAGDLEERWNADKKRSRLFALVRVLRVAAAVLWHARRERRAGVAVPTAKGDSLGCEAIQDLRFACRLSVRQPWFTAAAVITLALGIGATTAIFSVVNAWLLEPLPFRDPSRIVVIWETIPSSSIFSNTPAPASLREWRSRATSVESFAAWTLGTANLVGVGEPAQLTAALVSVDLLPLLGVDPAIGRNFTPEELQPNGPAVAILTHALWTTRFAGRPDVIGQQISLSGRPTTVVGVLPPGLQLLNLEVDLWQPLVMDAEAEASENRMLWVLGRLRDGASVQEAAAELDAIMRARTEGLGARVVGLREETVGDMGHDILVLFGATGFVLLIACANVASLSMARMAGRRQELLVRTALGAGGMRLGRQVLTESIALPLAGGLAGLLVAAWATRVLLTLTAQAAYLQPVEVATTSVFGFAMAAAFLAALTSGLFPAWQSSRASLASSLRETAQTTTAGRRLTLRSIVVAEIALALALLVGAALVARSYHRLATVDLGFEPHDAVAFQIPRPRAEPSARSTAFLDELLGRLRDHPAIESAGLIQALPLRSAAMGSGFRIEGRTGEGSTILSYWRVISPDYFKAMGIPLRTGRSVADSDVPDSRAVAIVTESFARRAWPTEPALGKRIGWATLENPLTVVGVVGDIKLFPGQQPGPHVYMPFRQAQASIPSELVVRSNAGSAAVIDIIRQTIRELDPNQPVAEIATLETLADRALGRRRFHLTLFSLFAGVAVVLALVGIYGVLSYMVSQMEPEVGLRLALGATPRRVAWTVLKAGMLTSFTGVALGLTIALWSTELMRGVLFGIEATDPLTYAITALMILTGAATACLVPALRAARVDPLTSLRSSP
jgi:predicted permease